MLHRVERQAKALSARAYAKPNTTLPDELRRLKYEQYQDIRFKTERMHWRGRGLPIELAFFHRGAIHLRFDVRAVGSHGLPSV